MMPIFLDKPLADDLCDVTKLVAFSHHLMYHKY